MDIHSIDIKYYHAGMANFTIHGLSHIKSLPYLSIAQSLTGNYLVSIDNSPEFLTDNGGAFIAPANKLQSITHKLDSKSSIMKAQWLFLDVMINGQYHFDDIFEFPVILPTKYNKSLFDAVTTVTQRYNICDQMSAIYKFIKCLLDISRGKAVFSPEIAAVIEYINGNYREKLNVKDIAAEFYFSMPTLFRRFKKECECSPIEYINRTRLSNAAHLLRQTNMLQKEIAEAVGIIDQYYFSKLFKDRFGVSPSEYRKDIDLY